MGLSYSGINIPFCLTESHSSEPELDPSGVDTLFTKTTIRIRGVIHPADSPVLAGETLAGAVSRITHLMTLPRRRLVYSVGSTTMIDVSEDDANGPQPDAGAFTIQPLEGSFVVTFAVTVRLRRCESSRACGFLSLKWSDQETDDLRGNKTRRRSGLLIVSRGFTPNADDRRNVVIPLVPQGFRRESADYTLSEDGLRLKFLFIDKQLHKGVPAPAVKVSGSMAETVPLEGGLRRGELSVKLEGRPGTNPRDLLNAAIRIGMSRVYASNPARDEETGRFLMGGGVRESLNDDETAVTLNLAWHIKPSSARLDGRQQPDQGGWGSVLFGGGFRVGQNLNTIANVFGSWAGGTLNNRTPENRQKAALPVLASWLGKEFPGADLKAGVPSTTRGTGFGAAVRPLAEFLYDPCGMEAELSNRATGSEWVGTGPDGSTVTARPGDPRPDDREAVPADSLPGIWDYWTMAYTFTETSGYGVVPATKPDAPGEVVRFGNPTKRLYVKWSLRRIGAAPPLPEVKVPRPGGHTGDGTHDENWVGLRLARTYNNVTVGADGVSFVYEAAGEVEWEALDPKKVGEAYPVPPWITPAKRPQAVTDVRLRPGSNVVGQFSGVPVLIDSGLAADINAAVGGVQPVWP